MNSLPDHATATTSNFNHLVLNSDDDDSYGEKDICRVCRLTGDGSAPLYHPCLCTGSIKYVHQDCLLEWLKYSKKDVCELCNHKFSFKPIYREDMPERLPIYDIIKGIAKIIARFIRLGFTYLFVAICWLGIVPMIACRVHRAVFSGSISSFLSLKILQIFSAEGLALDILRGGVIVAIFLGTFIVLVFLREQIIHGAPANLLHLPAPPVDAQPPAHVENNNNNNEEMAEEDEGFDENEPLNENDVAIPEIAAPPANDNQGVERLVDDMTWHRLLGLDGSFVFIEHVFWVILLNVVFTVVFLFFPSKIGEAMFKAFDVTDKIQYFETALAILSGYIVIFLAIALIHRIVKILRFKTIYWCLGMAYLVLKVFLLVVMEVVLFPTLCGWWLDICSLPLTGSTLSSRIKSFSSYPTTSMFVHWLVGMVDVFYSASFVLFLREHLRPGVLWFIRNLNDPEFNPVQEMIEQPVSRHFRRLIASTTLFFSIILLVVYCPLRVIKIMCPSILPYSFSLTAETPLGEFSLELILLQVVMPTLLEHATAFSALKKAVVFWCRVVGGWLNLETYLLPANALTDHPLVDANTARVVQPAADADLNPQPAPPPPQQQQQQQQPGPGGAAGGGGGVVEDNLAARHHAFLMIREPTNVETYIKPKYFPLRITALLGCLAITSIALSVLLFTVPVSIGRGLAHLVVRTNNIHDMYTVAGGLYVCWLLLKLWLLTREWLNQGWNYVCELFKQWAWLIVRLAIGLIPLLVVIPFMVGLWFTVLVIGPLRVNAYQTPLFFHWKEWAMGIVHFKLFCATILMGPEWWLKNVFEQIYLDGIRGFRLQFLYKELILPLVNHLSFQIAFPYVVSHLIAEIFDLDFATQILVTRYSYPITLVVLILGAFSYWQWSKLKDLAHRIRNDKYLIGTQLVNFYRDGLAEVQTQTE